MAIFGCGLESCTHTHTKHGIRPRCTKVKQRSNHRVTYLLINRCATHIKIKMTISVMEVLMGFALSMPNFFSMPRIYFVWLMKVPYLACLIWNPRKNVRTPHHGHFKPIDHDFAKFITKGFVSRIKNNIINIYLAYKQICAHLSSEESRIRFTNL
jgi:hypothetical protein